ncbi:unnamed protein product [Ilex paraguariensis]|uniref:TPX2 C-terminal domain-containing protein n=1 Tax=Ilex paraguariensis TaxID=185542 RepID=A0ABC8UHF0_9AQUA
MGEPTCVVNPFSYASGLSNEAHQGNPMPALGESISFGRFMSESLAWEKWSTFSHNRYVEEAERYAQPGSVAQKKAFFEAHYKRIAAKKAAALLEEQNAVSNNIGAEIEGGVRDSTTHDSQTVDLNSQVAVDEHEAAKTQVTEVEFTGKADVYDSNVVLVEPENGKMEGADLVTTNEDLGANPTKDELYNQLENQKMGSGELIGTPQMEKPLLKSSRSNQEASSPVSKKKPFMSSLKSSICHRPSKVPFSPAKTAVTIHARKENIAPTPRKPAIDSIDKNGPTPKSLRSLINFTPSREPNKFTNPGSRMTESSRVALSASKATKDCETPLRTPKMVSVNGVPKHPSATPCSENRRIKTPVDPTASGSKPSGPKWQLLSAVYTKSVSACRKKLQSPTLSTPFTLRTEERAARRKQKLEERFNAKEAQKVQLQTKLKEKAETELRKLRKSFCFKARPLPDFYKERDIPKNQIKQTQLTHPQSPKLGRKPSEAQCKAQSHKLQRL